MIAVKQVAVKLPDGRSVRINFSLITKFPEVQNTTVRGISKRPFKRCGERAVAG